MIDSRTIIILLSGVALILDRKRTAKQLYSHYAPLFRGYHVSLSFLSFLVVLMGVAIIAFGISLFVFGKSNVQIDLTGVFSFSLLFFCGLLYIFWSIPGYYRWKKTGKGIELGLFLTKLIIGILTIIGIVVGYILGMI